MPLELGGVSRSRDVLAEGRTLYLAHCAVCHGADGNGRGSMAAYDTYPQIGSFRDEKYAAYSPGKMFRSIRLGQGNMPAFGNILTAREIWCLVAFVRRLQALPAPPQEERPLLDRGNTVHEQQYIINRKGTPGQAGFGWPDVPPPLPCGSFPCCCGAC